jgi:ankyrin repeat protein
MDYIESEHLDKFQALFSAAGTTALLTTDHNGNTPLALSCQQNAPETALALLRASPAAAAMKNRDGNFPIQSFSECFKHNHDSHLLRTAFESLLVAYKGAAAEPNSEDVYLLHRVGQFGILDLVKLVYEMYPEAAKYCSGDKGTPLHQAALGCSVEIVEYLYSLYPEAANMTTEYSGASLLHFAARNNPEVLNAVYRYNPGAIRQATLDDGYLPLHELMGNYRSPLGMKPRMEMLRFLLQKYPAAAGVLDNRRRTPYHLLPQISDTKEALRLLLRAAPEVNPPELRRLNYEARRGALYLFFVAELPKSRVRVVTHSSIATPVDLRRSARQRGRNIQPTVALEPCHRARRVPNQLLGSRKLWRLLKGRGDRMLLKEIISFL